MDGDSLEFDPGTESVAWAPSSRQRGSPASDTPAWAYYVLAISLSLMAFAVSVTMPWTVSELGVGFLFLLTVSITAYAGGFGPGAAALILAAAGNAYLMAPAYSLGIAARSDVKLLGAFMTVSAMIVVAGGVLRPARPGRR